MQGEPLVGRSVLVTGGAGFIGSHLVDALREGNDVTVLDDLSAGRRDRVPDGVRLVDGDIRDSETLSRAAEGGVDVIFHLAANVSVPRSVEDPVWSHSVNVDGTLAVLELAREHGARVVFASSAAVYGDPETMPVSEDDPTDPLSPYGIEKLAGDCYVRAYHDLYGVETVALRYFNVYGPRQSCRGYASVIPAFVEAAAAGGPLTVHGDGRQTRDFVHVDDVVQATLLAATTEHVGRAFNVGAGCAVTINELAETVRELSGPAVDIVHEPPRPGDVAESRADIRAARELLGYEPTVSLGDGLGTLVV